VASCVVDKQLIIGELMRLTKFFPLNCQTPFPQTSNGHFFLNPFRSEPIKFAASTAAIAIISKSNSLKYSTSLLKLTSFCRVLLLFCCILAKIFGNILDTLRNQIKDAPNSIRHKKRLGTGQLPQKIKGHDGIGKSRAKSG
jgi:hypothetical protein